MEEINNRQLDLLNYLLNKKDFVSKKQICKDLPYDYPRHLENHNNEGNKSAAFCLISKDVRILNDKLDNYIIISSKKGYKLADNETGATDYVQRLYKEALRKLKLAHKLSRKIKLNHQLFFSENDIREFKTYIGEDDA